MVRRIGPLFAAVALLVVGFLAGGVVAPRVAAHAAPAPDKEAAGGRVGYVFIPRVVNEAKKAKKHAEQIEILRAKYANRMDFLRRDLQARQSELAEAKPGERPALERELVKVQRDLEDLDREARREVETVQRKLIAELYRDVSVAVADVAREHGLDAVQTYTAQPATADPMQIHTLLAAPAVPLYVRGGADYTAELIKRMNERFDGEAGQ